MAAVLVVALVAIYATRLGFAPIYLVHDEVNCSLKGVEPGQQSAGLCLGDDVVSSRVE